LAVFVGEALGRAIEKIVVVVVVVGGRELVVLFGDDAQGFLLATISLGARAFVIHSQILRAFFM